MQASTTINITGGGRFSSLRLNRPVFSASVGVLFSYLFAGLPVQIGMLTQLGLTGIEASNWFFITWLTTGLFSLIIALTTRMPLSINLSIPALIFLAGAAGGYTLPEILGANLAVGIAAVLIYALRPSSAFTRVVRAPVAMAVFAGSIFSFMFKTAQLGVTELAVVSPVIAGFVAGFAVTRNHLAATGVAAVSGFLAIILTTGMPGIGDAMTLPSLAVPVMAFNLSAIVSLGIPLLILTVGVGNIQSVSMLKSEGYGIKGNIVGMVAGAASVINALGGGHPASMGTTSVAVAAGPSAGPREHRFWTIVLSSLPVVVIALAAVPVIAVVQQLPVAYTLSIGALALFLPFRRVVLSTWRGPMRLGVVSAFVVATLPFHFFGMPMAFWAMVVGAVVATVSEHVNLGWFWPSNGIRFRLA
jgi:benzoate membrane transport protein